MYHWFLLIKKYLNKQTEVTNELIAGHGPDPVNSISEKANSKLFFLGLIEFIPTAGGIFASEYLDKILFTYDYFIAGILMSALLVKQLSKKAPEVPFSLHA